MSKKSQRSLIAAFFYNETKDRDSLKIVLAAEESLKTGRTLEL